MSDKGIPEVTHLSPEKKVGDDKKAAQAHVKQSPAPSVGSIHESSNREHDTFPDLTEATSLKDKDRGHLAQKSSESREKERFHTTGTSGRARYDTSGYNQTKPPHGPSASYTTTSTSGREKYDGTGYKETKPLSHDPSASYATTGTSGRARYDTSGYNQTKPPHGPSASYTTTSTSGREKYDGTGYKETKPLSHDPSASYATTGTSGRARYDTSGYNQTKPPHGPSASYTTTSTSGREKYDGTGYKETKPLSHDPSASYAESPKAKLSKKDDGTVRIAFPDTHTGSSKQEKANQAPFIGTEFVLFYDKSITAAQVKLFGLDVQMSKSSDSIYKVKIEIQSDYPHGQFYHYEIDRPGKFYGSSTYKSKKDFKFDGSPTYRDYFDGLSIEGSLAHMKEIERSNLDLNETYRQTKRLFSTIPKNKERAKIFSDISKEIQNMIQHNRCIQSVDLCFLVDNASYIDVQSIFSEETAMQLLKFLGKFRPIDFQASSLYFVSFLISKLIDKGFMHDKVMAELYYNYLCLGEQQLHDMLVSEHGIWDRELDLHYSDFAVSLFMKIFHSGSFESQTSKMIIARIVNGVPFTLTISTYGALMKMESEGESHVKFKELILKETFKRTEKRLTTLGRDRMASFLSIWEIVRGTGEGHVPFKQMFEKCLVKLMALPRLPGTKHVVQIVEEHILFVTPESKSELLKAVASSPNLETAELFTQLANVPAFDEVYANLPASTYEQWYYNSKETAKSMEKRPFDIFCRRLLFIVTQRDVQEKQEIEDFIKKLLFEELGKRLVEQVLKSAPDFEIFTKDNNFLSRCFLDYLSSKIQTTDFAKLFEPFLSDGVLQLNTRSSANILYLIIDKYGQTDDKISPTEQFLKAVDQHTLWGFVFASKGQYKSIVEKHRFYIITTNCIKLTIQRLSDLKIDFKFMKRINERITRVSDVLCFFENKEEVERLVSWNQTQLADAEKKLQAVIAVISSVKKQSITLPACFDEFCIEIRKKEESFYDGKIDGKNSPSLWKGMLKIPEYCRDLETVIQSVVFWNLLRHELTIVKKGDAGDGLEPDEPDEPELTISKEDTSDTEVQTSEDVEKSNISYDQKDTENGVTTWNTSVKYIEKMRHTGMKKYTEKMQCLLKTNEIDMPQILHMFDCKTVINPAGKPGPDLDVEKKVLEKVIPDLRGALAWETLKQIYNIGQIKTKIEGMRCFLSVIRADISSDNDVDSALNSFDQLLKGNVNDYDFSQVKTALDTIYAITNMLSDQTFDIMGVIGQCSSLIDFLKETVDEDIRNLIDAVEDISDQQVRETTVSGLIEVKQLLQPVLKQEFGLNCLEIINQFEKQTRKITKIASIPGKIQDCMDNLHNLKSLYNNVANRGEQTKQIVRNIIESGTFLFYLDENLGSVLVKARYKQTQTLMTELIDLRSRSLLLMNTESKTSDNSNSNITRDEVEIFVRYVEQCIEVAELCTQLHTSGHFMYIDISMKELLPSELAEESKRLDKELDDWQTNLSDERSSHYLMNYIHGFGLQSMYQYLNLSEGMSIEDTEKLEDTAKTILVFIHPDMEAEEIRKTYNTEKVKCKTWTHKDWLNCLGIALHAAYPDPLTITKKDILQHKDKFDSLKMTDVVQEGKLFVAQLDEHSTFTVRTVLALYANTVQSMPEPHQILFCTQETSLDEIELLMERCLGAKKFYQSTPLYCIADVELLPSELYFDLLDLLKSVQEEHCDFLLALVCRGTNSHPIINELSEFTTTIAPASDNFVSTIFKEKHGDILTLTSDLAGLGKSCKIIKDAHKKDKAVKILHVSGCAGRYHLIERLRTLKVGTFHALHIDIGTVDDPKALDTFLFELLVLGYVSLGRACVALGTKHVYVEIANTINDSLRNSLQTVLLFSRKHISWHNFDDFVVSKETYSGVQIACRYFAHAEKGFLDKKDIHLDQNKPFSTKKCRRLLKAFLGTNDEMSFPVVNSSLDVLADQFKKLSCSPFFRIARLRDMLGNRKELTVKTSLVKEMIESTREFASRSVRSCRATQSSTILPDTEHQTTRSSKPSDIATSITQRIDGMIRWEDSNHLMFVFHCQNIQTLSPLYRDRNKVPDNIRDLFQSQMNKKLQDFRQFNQAQLQDLLQRIARNNPLPLPSEKLRQLASEYALTPDNLLKMVLIMLRVKANVPVVIMGETGCGKTSLVRYLAAICEVDFDVMNIHAGVSEKSIVDRVLQNSSLASGALHSERWLFLDEINTSESIGIMTEIICHHKCLGESLPPNLIVMGACNPYKLRSKKDIATAGLTMKSKNDELSRLVYRVLPLPEMMVDYVWDFGSLNENDEKLYIQRMMDGLFEDTTLNCLFADMLSASQSFVRQKEESAYVVSLRDVYRCRLLTEWFINVLSKKPPLTAYTFSCNQNLRAMILALAHCYHSRFQHKGLRADYRNVLRAKLKDQGIPGFESNQDKVASIINDEQKDFITRMELPEGTACNTALVENVFVIIVCIYNRLPVFVVGKPGCSKSLAMQIIRSNLRGKDSKDKFFKTLPQLYCVSFQGSESSTSDGIIKVFEKAEKYQSSNNADDVLSVVILDEIGLAEVSRFNPLKVLHNLLEPDGEMRPNVAVVGLSNWSLDASKMNRAIHLSRTDMDEDELFETAKAISNSFITKRNTSTGFEDASFLNAIEGSEEAYHLDDSIDLDEALRGISKSYHIYSERLRFKNFHGLRDYYALVKYVAGTLSPDRKYTSSVHQARNETKHKLSAVVKFGLERNFGGLPSESATLHGVFDSHFHFETKKRQSVLNLITENVDDLIARHLMLITSGDSALGILEQQLNITGRSRKEVIFGSQFEDDLTDDYNYRILSRVILCMEEGIVLILKDLDNIYGSLYDMLNQNYTIIGNKKNCRVALGAYSNPICQVAESFRCIVLMDESKLDSCDPPFLNRFEKQYLRFSEILNSHQTSLVQDMQTWIRDLKDIQDRSFDYTDVFPIYSDDLLPSLVMKIEREYEKADENTYFDLANACKRKLMWLLKPEAVIRLKRAISSKTSLEADEIKKEYFDLPLHRGIEDLVSSQLSRIKSRPEQEGILTIVFTKSNMHVNLHRCFSNENVQTEKLGAFKSEKQVSAKIKKFWSEDAKQNILFVQCSAVDDEKHIMLTKSIIEHHRTSYYSMCKENKHVYLIIHMSTNKGFSKVVSQINFMSDWNLVMLDSLECPQTELPLLCNMDIFEAIDNKRPLDKCLTSLLFWSFTRIKYSPLGRDVSSIQAIVTEMKTSPEFLHFLDEEIWRIVSDTETREKNWQIKIACDTQALRNSSSFVDALEQHIIQVIKIPLTKVIFCLEENGILDSYFIKDDVSVERKQLWVELFHKEGIFSLSKIPDETGPECYSCETADCVLRMPFSKIIFSRIESQKDEFMKELSVLRGSFDVDDNEDLPPNVYDDFLLKQRNLTSLKVPDWMQSCYKSCEKDYIHDFSSLVSFSICSGMHKQKRASIMELIISQKTDLSEKSILDVSVRLHASVWLNIALFRSEMQLLAVCENFGLDVLDNMMQNSGLQSERNPDIEVTSDMYDTRTKYVQQKQVSSSDLSAEDYLVQDICKEIFPTKATVVRYGGISTWQRIINAILTLAAKVSTESKLLHALRVCNEIASNIIIPLQLEIELIYPLGDLLLDESVELDSEKVFKTVLGVVSAGLEKDRLKFRLSNTNCYRVFSSYLVRCISTNTETNILELLFKYVLEKTIPEEMIYHFRKPLYFAVDLESNESDENNVLQFFLLNQSGSAEDSFEEGADEKSGGPAFDSLKQEENKTRENAGKPEGSTLASSKDEEHETRETSGIPVVSALGSLKEEKEKNRENPDQSGNESDGSISCSENGNTSFVQLIDRFLRDLASIKRQDDPFVLLIVDLLVDQFENTIRNEVFMESSPGRFDRVYDCHKIILDEHFGLRFVTALAYVKSFISLLGEQEMWDYDKNRENWKAINSILSDVQSSHISISLATHFIKTVSKGLTIPQLKVNIETKKENHDFLEKITWTSGYSHFGFDGNPFCLLLDEAQHRTQNLCSLDLTTEKKLLSFSSDDKYNSLGLQRLLCFVFNEIQLSKTFESENKDTVKHTFQHFLHEMRNKTCNWYFVLKFLCGAEDFKCGFDLDKDSKNLKYSIQCVLLHILILLLSHKACEGTDSMSIFTRCLESPLTIKNCSLPGFIDSTSDSNMEKDSYTGLATCNCGSRIAFHFDGTDTKTEMECTFCSKSLAYEKPVSKGTDKLVGKGGILWKFDDIPTDQIEVRGMHPFTFHLLQMIVKGCLLGSIAFGLSGIQEVKELVGDAFSVTYLMDDITRHWNHLRKQLSLDDSSLSTLIRVIILETSQHFVKPHLYPYTKELRSESENDIEKQIEQILKERSNVVKSKVCQHHKLHGVKDESFENILSEHNDIDHIPERKSTLPLLFRLNNKPTKANFVSEIGWNKSEFPFLCLIVHFEKKLSLPQHIYSIIQWHVTAVASVNYMLKKHDCLEMTVQQFIFFNQKKKDMVKNRFDSFKSAWDTLCFSFKNTEIGSVMKHFHTGSKLKDCLVYDQETVIYRILKILVHIQNQFLDETLLIANTSEALHFLSVKENVSVFPTVQMTETRKEDLVNFQSENDTWDKILRDESLSRLEYGCGKETMYDFHSIEKWLAMKVLTGKSYIDFRQSIPNIIFADELYVNYADLLLELKKLIEQKPLTQEIIESIQVKKNDDPRMVKDLLSHLGILMTLLKKTGGDADEPLVDYVSRWSNLLSHEFPRALLPNPETSVKLCHIIALNELLEEICSETVLDALEKEYTDKLDAVATQHINELLRDLQFAGILLKALKRFMYRGIFSQTADADRPICGYLNDHSFWPDGCKEKHTIKIGEKEESVQNLLPDYLMVRHVQSLIKLMEKEIKDKEKDSVSMSEMATDFKKARQKKIPNKAAAKKARAKKFREY